MLHRAFIVALALALAGCATSDGGSDDGPRTSQGGQDQPEKPADLGTTYYLDYGVDCVTQEGELVLAPPGRRQCWHLPGGVVDAPRTFVRPARDDWAAGTNVTGKLLLYGQAPTPSDFVVRLHAGEAQLGEQAFSDVLLIPDEETVHEFAFATAADVRAGDLLTLKVAWNLPTVADSIVVGESQFTLWLH